MVEIVGKLKLHSRSDSEGDGESEQEVMGLVAECRVFKPSSILEIATSQTTFTGIVTLNSTILSIDTKYVMFVGVAVWGVFPRHLSVSLAQATMIIHPAYNLYIWFLATKQHSHPST